MIRNLFTFFLCFFTLASVAQYIPNSSQAFQFSTIYNPAFTGVDSYTDIRLGYRYQWTGINGGAPKSLNLSLNTRIKQPADFLYNTPRSSTTKLLRIPKKKFTIHALGLNVFSSSYGQLQTTGGSLNYAMHFLVSRSSYLSFGVEAVVDNIKFKNDGVILYDQNDPYYNQLVAQGSSSTQLNVRAGALFYSKNFYLGISYLPVWQADINSSDLAVRKPFYRASSQFGLSFPLGEALQLKPSMIGLLQLDNTFTADYTVKTYLRDIGYFGITYRSVKAGVVLLGINVNKMFGVSYSYEMSLSKFRQYTGGSHEIVLGVKLNNFKRQGSYTW
jgi:type IX secretion system PorP/SprF family membrane protein